LFGENILKSVTSLVTLEQSKNGEIEVRLTVFAFDLQALCSLD
jgi:hypothetical protein